MWLWFISTERFCQPLSTFVNALYFTDMAYIKPIKRCHCCHCRNACLAFSLKQSSKKKRPSITDGLNSIQPALFRLLDIYNRIFPKGGLFILEYVSELIAYTLCVADYCGYIPVGMSVNPIVYSTVSNEVA